MPNIDNKIHEPIYKFSNSFNEKYTLTITSDVKAGSVKFESVAQIRWMINVKNVLADRVQLEIITLENKLLKSNNPLVEELATTSQIFSTMYKEVELEIDFDGNIINILNLDNIRSKWHEIKEEMLKQKKIAGIENIIQTNDELFNTPKMIKKALQHNEFFLIYMHHFYGKNLPFKSNGFKKKNLLNTRESLWKYQYDIPQKKHYKDYITDILNVKITGRIQAPLDKAWTKETYQIFSHLDFSKMKPEFSEVGNYQLDLNSGKLLSAELIKKEIADEDLLYAIIHYKLESDSISKKANQEVLKDKKEEPFQVRKFTFIE